MKKISSFGIREWVDFVTHGEQAGASSIVLIECAPKVVDQLNMVANFAGGGRVFSFYAPFRCDYCDSEHRVLLQVDKDFEAIKSMKLAERPCPSCKESDVLRRGRRDVLLVHARPGASSSSSPRSSRSSRAKLDYAVGDRRLASSRVDKVIEGRITYLRLAGDLDSTFPREKLAEGLEGTVIVDVGGDRQDRAGGRRRVARLRPAWSRRSSSSST